jgi:CDP-diacylglycerol--glycerol-3-phosphate 3-phosphatidyltransferase
MDPRLPNRITIARIFIAGAFFALLGLHEPHDQAAVEVLLNVAIGVYVLAGISDVLDGYLARKYNLVSAFGRIADPVTDKVLVVGTFAMLAGANFALEAPVPPQPAFEWDLPGWLTGHMSSAVQAWMVIVVLAREFLVTAIRGYSESRGKVFRATAYGKVKMLLQSLAICVVLFQLANLPGQPWAVVAKIVAVWVAVIVTALTGLAYIGRTLALLEKDEQA